MHVLQKFNEFFRYISGKVVKVTKFQTSFRNISELFFLTVEIACNGFKKFYNTSFGILTTTVFTGFFLKKINVDTHKISL